MKMSKTFNQNQNRTHLKPKVNGNSGNDNNDIRNEKPLQNKINKTNAKLNFASKNDNNCKNKNENQMNEGIVDNNTNDNPENLSNATSSVNNQKNEDEVTKLFRSMIGIDTDKTATLVRQFACKNCYRAWWRRVRVRKQVSKCMRCKVKYEPIDEDNEFGIGEFKCKNCNHEFKTWSQKSGTSICKQCNRECTPLKILPANNNSKNSKFSEAYHNHTTNQPKYPYTSFVPNTNGYCKQCLGTCIDLNSSIIFRPQNYPYFDYILSPNPNYKKGTSFCQSCRKIPTFSNFHVSTGSTLPSLSYQDDLEFSCIDDNENLEACIEEDSESEIENNVLNTRKQNSASSIK